MMLVHRAMIPSALMTLYPLDCSTSSHKHILLVPVYPYLLLFISYIFLLSKQKPRENPFAVVFLLYTAPIATKNGIHCYADSVKL